MPRNGLKWTYYDDALPAWVAEMDYGLAPAISEALHQAVNEGLTGYPYPDAEWATAVAASGFWQGRYGWTVAPEHIHPAPDVIEGIRRAIVHLTRPDSPVVIHSPVYFPFYGMIERAGREIVEIPSLRDGSGRYSLDYDAIDGAFAAGAGSIVLCNPWNPTGRVFSVDELSEVVELARRHDVRVIADEIHGAITYDGFAHTPIATLDADRVVTVASASKAWNLPGLKCAQVVLTNESDRRVWTDFFTPEKVGVGTFGLIANEAAYRAGEAWLADVMKRLAENRGLLTGLVADILSRARLDPPEGTYLAWLDLSAYEIDDPAAFLLDEANVALTGGAPFGADSSRFVRFNFATDPEVVSEIVERMGAALPN